MVKIVNRNSQIFPKDGTIGQIIFHTHGLHYMFLTRTYTCRKDISFDNTFSSIPNINTLVTNTGL